MGTVISGALLGQDMTGYVVPGNEQPVNLVRMQEAYFSPEDGVFLDGIGSRSGGSFWYELTPNVFAGARSPLIRRRKALTEKWHTACQCWAEATRQMWHLNDFNFQAYDLARNAPWCSAARAGLRSGAGLSHADGACEVAAGAALLSREPSRARLACAPGEEPEL